ncbi:hypothetical protein ADE_18230 [Achromobacter denitrificans]|nr:hypothetical protein ADE_18230 [Achromobacter denitrificans]
MTTLRALQTLARSLLQAVPTVVGVILLSFFLLQAVPGDAADVIAAESGSATDGQHGRHCAATSAWTSPCCGNCKPTCATCSS